MASVATVEDVLGYLGTRRPEKIDADLLGSILDGAERFAEMYTGRVFAPDPALDTDPAVSKTFFVHPTRSPYVRVPDLRRVDGVMLDNGALQDGLGYELSPGASEPSTYIKLVSVSPYTNGSYATKSYSTLAITGWWGFIPAPPDVKDAVCTLAARRWREMAAAYADTIQTPEGGALSYYRQMPASVQAQLDNYRVPRICLV